MNRRRDPDAEARWVRSALREGAGDAREASPADPAEWPEHGSGDEIWRQVWAGLDLPPALGASPGFARRVALEWTAERARAEASILGAGWMRAAAAAALLTGVALGTSLAWGTDAIAVEDDSWRPTTLSEEYLSAIAAPDDALLAPNTPDVSDVADAPDAPLSSGTERP